MNISEIIQGIHNQNPRSIARAISLVENRAAQAHEILDSLDEERIRNCVVLGITGPPGAGKSTLTSGLIESYKERGHRVGIIAIDPSSPISGGAILGDRIRMMKHAKDPNIVMRSMATRGRLGGLCAAAGATVRILASSGCNPIIIETVGVGQSEIDIVKLADITALVCAPGLGDDIQAMKAGLLEVADLLIINKSDKPESNILTMEMREVAEEKGRPLCNTIATKSEGIDQVIEEVTKLDEELEKSGKKFDRRTLARKMEIVDWLVEMTRSIGHREVNQKELHSMDPLSEAKELLQTIMKEGYQNEQR